MTGRECHSQIVGKASSIHGSPSWN